MSIIASEGAAADGDGPARLELLKQFHSAGRGFWADVPEADWNDWRWQLKHRITTLEQLERLMPSLTPEEHAGTRLANTKLALAITPYFFNLIDPADENCPIRRQSSRASRKPTPLPGKCPIRAARTRTRPCPAWCIAIPTACCFS